MRTLFLMRHAKSSWKENLADHERGLNKRGKKNAPMMAERLLKNNRVPQHIVTSSAKRALLTAEMMQKGWGNKSIAIEVESDLYLADCDALLEAVHAFDLHYESVMLVGHNPDITDFCNRLCAENIENMPTASIAKIDFDVKSWRDVAFENGVLDFFDYPKSGGLSSLYKK